MLCMSMNASAQSGNLTGKLVDGKGVPLTFANVAVLKAADVPLAFATDDPNNPPINGRPGRY